MPCEGKRGLELNSEADLFLFSLFSWLVIEVYIAVEASLGYLIGKKK